MIKLLIADDHPLFRSALQQALTLGLGDDVRLSEAASIAELEALVQENPEDGMYHHFLGMSYAGRGEFERAVPVDVVADGLDQRRRLAAQLEAQVGAVDDHA